MKCLLTVAGLDPSGGAGLGQDLGVFAAQGFHGLCVPTALVPQGPRGVRALTPVNDGEFALMLQVLTEEVDTLAGVKIGVLVTQPQAEKLAEFLRTRPEIPLVIDPVLRAKNGTPLSSKEAVRALLKKLPPLRPFLTPNLSETEVLTGGKVHDLPSMKEGARALYSLGAKAVVVTGGHLPETDELADVFYDGQEFLVQVKSRIAAEVHGTGCLFSALLLTFLARGYPPAEAFFATEAAVEQTLSAPYPVGDQGYLYVSPPLIQAQEAERFRVLRALQEAAESLAHLAPTELVPAVQMNFGYALPDACTVNDVAAFPGRIGVWKGKLLFKEQPAFGASSHVARLILTMMRRFPWMRSCLNLRFAENCVQKARSAGLVVCEADRTREPQEVRDTEGGSLDFLMEEVLADCSCPPDLVYDRGDVGKEPMIRLFGRSPAEVLKKLEAVRP